MYYTVEQASKELNISKQAIYKQIKKEEFKQFIIIEKGIKHINSEGLNYLKGENPLEKVVKQQVEEIERLRADNKRLMILLEQQNKIILNSQELQKKALNNTELLLLEKREELKRRAEEYNKRSNHWFKKFKIKFT
ncbi:helix-turn-helix domain-containing protein [Clostridium perfringens]|uniref:helix-turn-helix domain-containing protein n=1 Tax=Clostridium perfringens TaxID=1502 RepID=UPI001A33FB23|nr:helix-turn-helix domain-containing protein [Clostridium perfringens]HAT4108523.1 helix-turn-helix domain-containing protein [Clostridium perfringens]